MEVPTGSSCPGYSVRSSCATPRGTRATTGIRPWTSSSTGVHLRASGRRCGRRPPTLRTQTALPRWQRTHLPSRKIRNSGRNRLAESQGWSALSPREVRERRMTATKSLWTRLDQRTREVDPQAKASPEGGGNEVAGVDLAKVEAGSKEAAATGIQGRRSSRHGDVVRVIASMR